jgi:hypothetical protein
MSEAPQNLKVKRDGFGTGMKPIGPQHTRPHPSPCATPRITSTIAQPPKIRRYIKRISLLGLPTVYDGLLRLELNHFI